MSTSRQPRVHATKVAIVATAVVVVCYAACAIGLSVFVVHRLTRGVDARIQAQIATARHWTVGQGEVPTFTRGATGGDLDDAPVFVWRVGPHGGAQPVTVGAPALPRHRWTTAPATVTIGSIPFRLETIRTGGGWIVGGQSVAEIVRVRAVLLLPEVLFGLLVAAATFVGSLVVGLRASAPLELVRRRQAEFTADASHELRTPLSVVEAEVGLALQRRRTPEEYEAVLRRIAGEGRRLRRIVEDLLWLARADSGSQESPEGGRCDVGAVALACVERFQAVASRGGVALTFATEGQGRPLVDAPREWIDRLGGVLIDNACKYAGDGGEVEVVVRSSPGRVVLRVDDSGPGIPPAERQAVFDRFHRAATDVGGSGLGLAIADSVVRITGGAWAVGDSPLGGARMDVAWRKANERAERSLTDASGARSPAAVPPPGPPPTAAPPPAAPPAPVAGTPHAMQDAPAPAPGQVSRPTTQTRCDSLARAPRHP